MMTGPKHKADAAIASIPDMPPPPRDHTALVGYGYFEWLPEAWRRHRHNADMIEKGPFHDTAPHSGDAMEV
jgi:hypothetical protein